IEVAAVFASLVVKRHWRFDIGCSKRSTERATRYSRQDLGCARRFLGRCLRLTNEQLLPRSRFADTSDVIRSLDIAGAQSRDSRRIVRFQAVAKNRLPHILLLRWTVDECESDLMGTGRHFDSRRSHPLVDFFA